MNKSLSRRAFLRTSIASGASLAAAAAGAAPAGIYRPGTYSAKASGIGEVTVTMTFDADRIIDVVLDVSHETPGIGQAAADTLKKNLMAAQAAEIDGVSGATITSKAVSKAAAKCIAQAKGEIPVEVISDTKTDEDDGDWLGKEPEIAEKDIVATHETDILVVGCGTGGLFAVAAAAEAGGKVIGIDRFAVGTGIREDLGAIDSRYQKAWGTKIDKFEFITMATQYAGGHIQQDLVKLWCDKSGEAIDWVGDRLAERNIELWHESGDKNDETCYNFISKGARRFSFSCAPLRQTRSLSLRVPFDSELIMNKSLSRRAFLRTSIASGASLAAAAAGAAPAGIYRPGTYSAKASGIGEVTVTMTFDADRIIDVVLDVSHETPGIGQAAADTLKKNLMAAQAAEIDGVSGATITSKAVSKAAAKCIAQAKGEIPVEVISDTKTDEDDGDWLGKEPEIAEKDIVATHETDILVVGCGTGGLFAVAAAAEAGGKVIGIDRFAVGTGIREDLGAIDSRYQKAWGTKIDKFEFITMATQYAGGHIQQDLVKLWCDKSGEAIDWVGDRLAERNIELWHESGDKNDETRYKHFAIGHSPKLPIDPKTGKFKITLAQVVEQYAAKKGARFDYNTKMVKLEKKNGRVTGVIAENADGKYVRYNAAKGVVVATGGYAQNWKMMEALQPWNLRIIGRSGALPGARGDGIRACLWAGAKMDETHSIMMFDRTAIRPDQQPGPDTVKSGDSGFFWIGSQPWLKVNADGRRFMNESGTYENILHADEYQKGHCHYTIFDSNWVKYAEQFKMHGCSRLFPFENGAEPNIPWEVFRDRMLPGLIAKGYVQKADTIEELAKKLGLPAAQLKATVARNNELYRTGEDVDYGKEKHRLSAVDKAPFYGAKNTGWMLCTMDGIQINTNMNAIDTEGNPIPGLFVIGNDSGGYFANEYPNLATGMACGRTVTFGRIVGRMLAKA